MKIVYFTSGIPGTGRIVQGLSIYNALIRQSIKNDFIILSYTPLAGLADKFNVRHIEVKQETENELSRKNYKNSILYKTLLELKPDILVVDRMWFSLNNFIDTLPCKKIFISIQVREEFFKIRLPEEELVFNPAQYDGVLAIEPFQSAFIKDMINPLILKNRDEILPRERALKELGLSGKKTVCLIALNYIPGYYEKLKSKYSYLESAGYEMVYTSNLKGGGIFPIIDYFNAIDLVVCAAGYTQFWEVVYFDKEGIMEVFPLRFTSMQWRLDNCSDFRFEENGADQLALIIENL